MKRYKGLTEDLVRLHAAGLSLDSARSARVHGRWTTYWKKLERARMLIEQLEKGRG